MQARAIFQTAAITTVGDGQNALFWEDRWIQGHRVQDLAPKLYLRIPRRVRDTRTVFDALQGGTLARDIGPDMDNDTLREFLTIWERIHCPACSRRAGCHSMGLGG